MKKLKKIWKNDLGKFILSFLGLILLFLMILIRPGLTYLLGDEITVRVYEDYMEEYGAYGILEINRVSLELFDEAMQEDLLDQNISQYQITNDQTVYAIFDTTSQISVVKEVTTRNPESHEVYLKVDFLYIIGEPNGIEEDLYVDVRIDLLENALYQDYIEITNTSTLRTKDIEIRIWRNHLIVTNRD